MCVYQQIHHVGFVVPQSFNSVKDVDTSLLSQHLTHDADAAENTAATAAIPEGGTREEGGVNCCSTFQHMMETNHH